MSDIRERARQWLHEINGRPEFKRLMDRLADKRCNDPACVERDCVVMRFDTEGID